MKIRFGAEGDDPGVWMVFDTSADQPAWRRGKDPDELVGDGDAKRRRHEADRRVYAKVRVLPTSLETGIDNRWLGKRDIRITRSGDTKIENGEPEKVANANREKATFVLLDTRNFEAEAATAKDAAALSRLVGVELASGGSVDLAGQWLKEGVKAHVFGEFPGVAMIFVGAAAALKANEEEDEAGKA